MKKKINEYTGRLIAGNERWIAVEKIVFKLFPGKLKMMRGPKYEESGNNHSYLLSMGHDDCAVQIEVSLNYSTASKIIEIILPRFIAENCTSQCKRQRLVQSEMSSKEKFFSATFHLESHFARQHFIDSFRKYS